MNKDLKVFCTKVGGILTNCYVVYDIATNEGFMVDPGAVSSRLDMIVEPIDIKYILITHGHFDHIGAAAYYKEKKNCKVMMMANEIDFIDDINLSLGQVKSFKADKLLYDGDTISFNSYTIDVIATPGHTKGGCCYILDDFIFTGDTLMEGSVGRIDFPTGSYRNLKDSLTKLKKLNKNYTIYPGHGQSTSLSLEKASNLYLQKL